MLLDMKSPEEPRYTDDEWKRIETNALKLGANEEQIRKWQTRGVAAVWHAKLIKSDRKLLALFAQEPVT